MCPPRCALETTHDERRRIDFLLNNGHTPEPEIQAPDQPLGIPRSPPGTDLASRLLNNCASARFYGFGAVRGVSAAQAGSPTASRTLLSSPSLSTVKLSPSPPAHILPGHWAPGPPAPIVRKRKRRPPARARCDICGVMFGQASAVRKHRRAVHEKLREWVCDECGMRFAEKSNLKKHAQARHGSYRPHECKECGKRFNFTDGLRRHINNCHLGLRPHACDLCSLTFKQRTHFRKHRASIHRFAPPLATGPASCPLTDAAGLE